MKKYCYLALATVLLLALITYPGCGGKPAGGEAKPSVETGMPGVGLPAATVPGVTSTGPVPSQPEATAPAPVDEEPLPAWDTAPEEPVTPPQTEPCTTPT